MSLPAQARQDLLQRRTSLVATHDKLAADADTHDSKCGSVVEGSEADRRCQTAKAEIENRYKQYVDDLERFDTTLTQTIRFYFVHNEEASMRASPSIWYRAASKAVQAIAIANPIAKEAEKVFQNPHKSPLELTSFSQLLPGDVILLNVADLEQHALESLQEREIRLADYRYRLASNFVSGSVFQMPTTLKPASHAITFVKEIDGTMLFLDHTLKGSRILDQKRLLEEYGHRDMHVARPLPVIDAKELWAVASEAARKKKSDYKLVGNGVVCSERCGNVLARAMGRPLTTGRLGPVDITPGDFFVRDGPIGKHFIIMDLKKPER